MSWTLDTPGTQNPWMVLSADSLFDTWLSSSSLILAQQTTDCPV